MKIQPYIRFSVRCEADEIEKITLHLGLAPTIVSESRPVTTRPEEVWYRWSIEKDLPEYPGGLEDRVREMIETLRPAGERIATLRTKWKPALEVCFCRVGVNWADFDVFLPSDVMKTLGDWRLDFQFNEWWFDYPGIPRPPPERSVWSRIFGR